MINRNLLEAKIKENGMNVEKLASILEINKATLYRKLKGDNHFYKNEILKISKVLNLEISIMELIFFPELVT